MQITIFQWFLARGRIQNGWLNQVYAVSIMEHGHIHPICPALNIHLIGIRSSADPIVLRKLVRFKLGQRIIVQIQWREDVVKMFNDTENNEGLTMKEYRWPGKI